MPNVKSAKKRVKTNERRQVRNSAARSQFRTALKKVNKALESEDAQGVEAALPGALRLIGRSSRKGIIHRNKAARQESRLVRKVNALKAGKTE
ncbi:30S ribosomal protein S20 [Candidatus Sumerlaeota bacterium]|nr:30S ribosomal protein S20 [Candidatus Sumerlaeota bacterium]